MQIGYMRLAALAALSVFLMGFEAKAACQGSRCKNASVASVGATDDKPMALSKFSKRKSYVSRKNRIVAKKSNGEAKQGSIAKADSGKTSAQLPSWFANAQAAIPGARVAPEDDQTRNIAAVDDNETITLNGVQIASAEQLNDIDRAMAEDKPVLKVDAAASMPTASPSVPQGRILRPVASGERQMLSNTDDNTWGKTSLIGKIFIAVGSLLTVASAARMLIA